MIEEQLALSEQVTDAAELLNKKSIKLRKIIEQFSI